MTEIIPWAKEYGDDERERRFAGRFVGYDPCLISPAQSIPSDKPIVLLLTDSIFGGIAWKTIQNNIKDTMHLNFIQHPHHAGNIDRWLDIWGINEWKHYSILFHFEGMHGFPPRQSPESHKDDTLKLIQRYKKIFPTIIWGNMIPIPPGFKTGVSNNSKGPNSIEQDISDKVVQETNNRLKNIMELEKIPLIDLYSIIRNDQKNLQRYDDIHLTHLGSINIANAVSSVILKGI